MIAELRIPVASTGLANSSFLLKFLKKMIQAVIIHYSLLLKTIKIA